jgi:putative flippase GtrA
MIGRTLMRQSTRYLAGGITCALIHNAIVIATCARGMPYPAAIVLSFCVVTPIGYMFHSAYTFEALCSTRRLQRYMAAAVGGFFVSAVLMVVFCSGLRVPVAIATPIVTMLMFIWNFTLARWAILDLLTPWESPR